MNTTEIDPIILDGLSLPPVHPLAELLPRLNAHDRARLREDVEAHGVLVPVTIFAGRLLDGRHRLQAARDAGVMTVPAVELRGTMADALAFVMSHNVNRRHLSGSQRALMGARIRRSDAARASWGEGTVAGGGVPLQWQVAEAVGVAERYIRDAERLLESAREDVIGRVDAGELSLREALRIVFPPAPRERRAALVDPMPANPTIEQIPQMDPEAGNVITQAARAVVAMQSDPTAWIRTLSADDARALIPALESFARAAVDHATEEGTLPTIVVPVPESSRAPRRSRAARTEPIIGSLLPPSLARTDAPR
jgi:ParB-like chromosome segregation protein Spo0J